MLLIYEHFKAQTRSKTLTQVVDESMETRSSSFSSNTNDIQSISSEDKEENFLSGKKANIFEKKLPSSTKSPCRNCPKGLGLKIIGQEDEEYNKEGDDVDNDEENKEEEDVKREDLVAKK